MFAQQETLDHGCGMARQVLLGGTFDNCLDSAARPTARGRGIVFDPDLLATDFTAGRFFLHQSSASPKTGHDRGHGRAVTGWRRSDAARWRASAPHVPEDRADARRDRALAPSRRDRVLRAAR